MSSLDPKDGDPTPPPPVDGGSLVTLGRREAPAQQQQPEDADPRAHYWRNLAESRGDALEKLIAKEFPEVDGDDGVSRRGFLQFMGASAALASMAACRKPEQNILPFARRPEGRVPGETQQYATSMDIGGAATGLLITCFDGRPIKVEGNPLHPASLGAASAMHQGAILELYDPERSDRVLERSGEEHTVRSWVDFGLAFRGLLEQLQQAQGSGLSVLSRASSSPTLQAQQKQLAQRFPQAKFYEYEAASYDNEREGLRMAFGAPHRALYAMDKARVWVAFDDDMFVNHPMSVAYSRQFMVPRRPEVSGADMSRLYAVESRYTLVGSKADNRLPLRSEHIAPFLMALEARLGGGAAPGAAFLQDPFVARFLEAIASDLQANPGAGLVTVGFGQPAEVHALVARINDRLGNAGNTVSYAPVPDPERLPHMQAIAELTRDMAAGNVNTLLMLGGNPVYDAPADLGFTTALAKVDNSIHLSHYVDETSRRCKWHLPEAHFMEAWGDARAWDGTVGVVQPLVEPLKHGRSAIEVLSVALGQDYVNGKDLVRQTFQGDEAAWRRALHDGVVDGSARSGTSPSVQSFQPPQLTPTQLGPVAPQNGQLELVFFPSMTLHDGRFANNGWLQETPDFISKIVWDNALLMGVSTARALGFSIDDLTKLTGSEENPLVAVTVGDRVMELPVYVVPGMAPGTMGIALGYGRTAAGTLGGNERDVESVPVGFDSYGLRTLGAPWIATSVKAAPSGGGYQIVTTANQYLIDTRGAGGRAERLEELVREDTLAVYQAEPDFAKHRGVHSPPIDDLWPEVQDYSTGFKWGMAVDMQTCTGCQACVVACVSENNVLIVGKDEVRRGRIMHWLRVDRYFEGSEDNPRVAHQPMPCQHCENAPCESVCPVAATSHSEEGLNDMTYNRCIGTRYCGNNCPYKVRRFNYKNWQKEEYEEIHTSANELKKLRFNPEVTVRFRGVMEKCTFCVQRIKAVTIPARNRGDLRVEDGAVTPACAQTCPTDSIVFGDLNDPGSRVAKLQAQPRSYPLLAWLNTRPRNQYLAAVTNPHPSLAPPAKPAADGHH